MLQCLCQWSVKPVCQSMCVMLSMSVMSVSGFAFYLRVFMTMVTCNLRRISMYMSVVHYMVIPHVPVKREVCWFLLHMIKSFRRCPIGSDLSGFA